MVENSVIPIAFLLDLILGDPHWLPHPVRWMGQCIVIYEKHVRSRQYSLTWAGIVLAVGFPVCVWLISFFLLKTLYQLNVTAGWLIEIWLVYQCVSAQGLIRETRKVYHALHDGHMEKARHLLAMIVGRDTDRLEETEISRAAVETVAEGTVDGVLSPLFFAAIGAAPLALAYKAVNTLDSMVGYKNERYMDFGWASAKLDDLVNWIPARLSIVLIPLAAILVGQNAGNSFRIGFRDRLKHTSPNAGHAEAAYAGALGVRLGGRNVYQGLVSQKPILNVEGDSAQPSHILKSWNTLLLTSILFIALTYIMNWLIVVGFDSI